MKLSFRRARWISEITFVGLQRIRRLKTSGHFRCNTWNAIFDFRHIIMLYPGVFIDYWKHVCIRGKIWINIVSISYANRCVKCELWKCELVIHLCLITSHISYLLCTCRWMHESDFTCAKCELWKCVLVRISPTFTTKYCICPYGW
jgi:hypothetical protein